MSLKNKIEEANKEFPMLEYFLSSKPFEECSPECQKQVRELEPEPFEVFHAKALEAIDSLCLEEASNDG